jgi:hypothetical protein
LISKLYECSILGPSSLAATQGIGRLVLEYWETRARQEE